MLKFIRIILEVHFHVGAPIQVYAIRFSVPFTFFVVLHLTFSFSSSLCVISFLCSFRNCSKFISSLTLACSSKFTCPVRSSNSSSCANYKKKEKKKKSESVKLCIVFRLIIFRTPIFPLKLLIILSKKKRKKKKQFIIF